MTSGYDHATTSFTDAEQIHKKRKIRRERFLERMDKLIPWNTLEDLIQPFYYQNVRQACLPFVVHVANPYDAVVLQSERSRYGRCALWNRLHALFCKP